MRVSVLCLALLVACGQSNQDKIREQMEREAARNPDQPAKPVEKKEPGALPSAGSDKKAKAAPDPEPTTPEEIDTARKKAMNEGRDKDVIKYCEAGNVDPAKSDSQALLGCTLAACRLKDADKARKWAPGMLRDKKDKPLYDQAKKTCLTNNVGI